MRKTYPFNLEQDSPEYEWLSHQRDKKRSLTYLIRQAMAQYGNDDVIDAVLMDNQGVTLTAQPNSQEVTPKQQVENIREQQQVENIREQQQPVNKPKTDRPQGLARLSQRN